MIKLKTFTASDEALTNLETFKNAVLNAFGVEAIADPDFSDRDWRIILSDVRTNLLEHSEIVIIPVENDDGQVCDVDFAFGKATKSEHFGSTMVEVQAAQSALAHGLRANARKYGR